MPVSPWFAAYLVVGPVFAVVLVTATLFGRHRLDRLILRSRTWRRQGQPTFEQDTPSVTVVVPVKDEAGAIESCVRSLLEQDYPRLDVLVINDRSTDGTREILDHLAEEVGERLRVRHLTNLPDGWLGKPHALHTGVTQADDDLGDWLVFVDSDVECSRDAVSHCMAIAQQRDYQMVSLLTGLIAPTIIERLVTPTAAATWMVVFRAADTNDDNKPRSACANGQYLMLRRDVLAEVGGHASVKDKTCEDVELARLVKEKGHAVRFFVGRHLAWTRMHATWSQLFNGWARNFAGSARHRRLPLLAGIAGLLTLLLPALAIAWGLVTVRSGWWLAGVVHAMLVVAWFVIVYRAAYAPTPGDRSEDSATRLGWAGCTGLALLHPVAAVATIILLFNGLRVCGGGTVTWRGSEVRA